MATYTMYRFLLYNVGENGNPPAAFLPGVSHRQRSLSGPWGHKESGMTERCLVHRERCLTKAKKLWKFFFMNHLFF